MNRISTATWGGGTEAPKPLVTGALSGAAAKSAMGLGSGTGVGEAETLPLAWSF